MSSDIFFSGWASLGRTLLIGTLAYVSLVLMLRISGKRTLAKMNSFDLIVTVALGSTLASALLTKNVALADGVTAFALLIVLQFLVTWSSVRVKFIRGLVRAEPRLLFHRGEFLDSAMRDERVTQSEILQAIRSQGHLAVEEVEGVVLETDGTFSVLPGADSPKRTSLDSLTEDLPEAEDTSASSHVSSSTPA
jgi:uncharacterized membrane protein YcaP (DUF421 family)